MVANDTADRSSVEIRTLLRHLDPNTKAGRSHNDRVKRMARFRAYVAGDGTTAPEFYDDDLPSLFTGETEDGGGSGYSLLKAAGAPSSDHGDGQLKRSARHAVSLLKWLVCDHRDPTTPSDGADADAAASNEHNNAFSDTLCALPPSLLAACRLSTHVAGGGDRKRGGDREDACALLLHVFLHHETPFALEEVLPEAATRAAFETWVVKSRDAAAYAAFNKRVDEVKGGGSDDDDDRTHMSRSVSIRRLSSEMGLDDNARTTPRRGATSPSSKDKGSSPHNKNNRNNKQKGSKQQRQRDDKDDKPTRWADSRLAAEDYDLVRRGGVNGDGVDDVDASERRRIEDDKGRLNGRDPLGLRGDDFDLREVQAHKGLLVEREMAAFKEGEQSAERDSFMAVIEKSVMNRQLRRYNAEDEEERARRREAEEDGFGSENDEEDEKDEKEEDGDDIGSILPIDPDFDPMLFLTLVHGKATYNELQDALKRLNNKQDNQVLRLQTIVRDNFALFIRCADGIDLFDESDDPTATNDPSVSGNVAFADRLQRLDDLAERCSSQARDSFKPLLDNTDEVRRTQSALAVLGRVSPLLQIPASMRSHVEAGRFAAAIKAYRRVRAAVEADVSVDLLRAVRADADAAAREARAVLERTLAGDERVDVTTLLDAVRDLGELKELRVGRRRERDRTSDVAPDAATRRRNRRVESVLSRNPTASACLLLQANHFSYTVQSMVDRTEDVTTRIFHGDSSALYEHDDEDNSTPVKQSSHNHHNNDSEVDTASGTETVDSRTSSASRRKKKWKYDVLEARVKSTVHAVSIARTWLNRLLRIGVAAMEAERRRAARVGSSSLQKKASFAAGNKKTTDNNGKDKSADDTKKEETEGNKEDEDDEENEEENYKNSKPPYEVFETQVAPALHLLVTHTIFCALGCSNTTKDPDDNVTMTFGQDAPEGLKVLLRTPLPVRESSRCATELVALVDVVRDCARTAASLRPTNDSAVDKPSSSTTPSTPSFLHSPDRRGDGASKTTGPSHHHNNNTTSSHRLDNVNPFEDCLARVEEAVVAVERRHCIYAFHVCGVNCEKRASGVGVLDGDALHECVARLADVLSRPEECAAEVEKGCQLVVLRCCEGLAEYVRDRGDAARLRAVAQCAAALSEVVPAVLREVGYLTNGPAGESAGEVMESEVGALEGTLFDEFLEEVRRSVEGRVRLGFLDYEDESKDAQDDDEFASLGMRKGTFPGYLSASLLALVRCRAQVEKTLGETTVRRSKNETYLNLAMRTASDSLVYALCSEVKNIVNRMTVRQCDRTANEIQFLINTLKVFLTPEASQAADETRRMLCAKAGKGHRGIQGDGPDGLAAIEELERLGRVYVMCLGD